MKAPNVQPFQLPLPAWVLHPFTALLIALMHVYLAAGHLLKLSGGEMTWTNIWKGFGALGGAYALARNLVMFGPPLSATLRAKEGAILGRFDIPSPYSIAFDGANIWVTGTPFVYELRPSDGAEMGRFRTPGSASVGVAFDGANMWIAAPFDNAIFKF
jgi:hypothetical protein